MRVGVAFVVFEEPLSKTICGKIELTQRIVDSNFAVWSGFGFDC